MVAEPAFKAALAVIETRAFASVVAATLKAVNVEIAHMCFDFLKAFYKLAVRGQVHSPFRQSLGLLLRSSPFLYFSGDTPVFLLKIYEK